MKPTSLLKNQFVLWNFAAEFVFPATACIKSQATTYTRRTSECLSPTGESSDIQLKQEIIM